jgi:hypothetical protein
LEKPLTAETIARSARIAAGRPAEDAELRRAVAERFSEVLPRVPSATVQQAMFLANSDAVLALFKPEPGTAAERLGALPNAEERARCAFRAALIREPDADELAQAVAFLEARVDRFAEAAGLLLWTLVTGPEFLTNH